jgi:carboxyl-terminal processing protease
MNSNRAVEAMMSFDQPMMREVLEKSVGLLEKRCIRLNGHEPNWRALFSEHRQEITSSASPAEFESRVNTVLGRGGLSHVAFFHESAQRAPARYAINATFRGYDRPDGSHWMFQDVHEGGPAYCAGVRPGDILLKANEDAIRPPVLPTFALGADHQISVEGPEGAVRQVQVVLPKAQTSGKASAKPPMAEPTSVTARVLRPGIGLVRIAFFPGINGQRFARELDRALAGLAECARLIIDLRGNLGGFVGSLRLMSYLTAERVPVGYSLTRKGEDSKWRPEQLACIDRLPSTTLDMIKMAVRFKVIHRDRSIRLTTEGLGPQPFHGRIAMLVNEHTLSAGEMVAAFASENRLARLVGTPTGGQVLGGANFSVGHGFTLRFPAAGWYTWRGSIVEGRGVPPEVDVPLSMDGLRHGNDNQLEAALAAVGQM